MLQAGPVRQHPTPTGDAQTQPVTRDGFRHDGSEHATEASHGEAVAVVAISAAIHGPLPHPCASSGLASSGLASTGFASSEAAGLSSSQCGHASTAAWNTPGNTPTHHARISCIPFHPDSKNGVLEDRHC